MDGKKERYGWKERKIWRELWCVSRYRLEVVILNSAFRKGLLYEVTYK